MSALTKQGKSVPLPTKPLIFYRRIKNAQGTSEFRPFFYFPERLLEEAREEQTGNVFATLLACFPANLTPEEMVESITDGPEKQALVRFFKQNPYTRKALTDKAHQARLEGKKEGEEEGEEEEEEGEEPSEKLVLKIPIRAPHFALVTQGDLEVATNLQGKSMALSSQEGEVTLKSKAARTSHGANYRDEVIDQRTLRFEGKLGIKAGKNILTQAVDIEAGCLELEAQGNVIDSALFLESHEERRKACKSFLTQAVDIEAVSRELEAQGNVIDPALFLKSHEERTSGDTFEQWNERKPEVSRIRAQNEMAFQGKNVLLEGTDAEADTLNLEVDPNEGKVGVFGVNHERSYSKTTEEETGALFWKGKKITHTVECSSQHQGSKLKAKQMNLSAQEVTLQAPEIETEKGQIDADHVKILQGKNRAYSYVSETSTNPIWISAYSKETEDHTFSQMKLQGQMQMNAKSLELEKVEGEVLEYLEQLQFDPEGVKVVNQLLEEIHKRHEKSISAPGPALVAAVAVVMSVATAGVGSAATTAIGIEASSLAGTVTSAAISTLSAKMATQVTVGVLSGKTPGEMLQQITSPETLKELATSTLTAGALHGLGEIQNAANTASCFRKMETAATQAGVGMGVNCAFGARFDEALKGAGVQFAAQAGSSVVAEQIGEHFAKKQDPLARGLHKAAHGASAAAFGAAGAAALQQDVATAAMGAASGAMVSEIVAEALSAPLEEDVAQEIRKQEATQGRKLREAEAHHIWEVKIEDISKIARLSGALSGLFTGEASGVYSAQGAAQTAVGNNFEKTLKKNWSETWKNLKERLSEPPQSSSAEDI